MRPRKTKERIRMLHAIEWALGTRDNFGPRPKGRGPYWWRTELQKSSGMESVGFLRASPENQAVTNVGSYIRVGSI
jgi:hypothetical protein